MEKGLITANTWFGGMQRAPGPMTFDTFRLTNLRRLRDRFHIKEAGYSKSSEPVKAFVNKGNWLVICPHCGGAEYAWEEGWFFCCSCKNSYLGHRYRRLVFPTDRAEIEAALVVRPLENRNWHITETVEDLERENKEHAGELLTAAEGG